MALRDQILEKMIERAAEVFKKDADELNEDTRWVEDLQAKSVQYVQVITLLEDTFDTEINFMAFRRKATFGESADFVVELLGE